MDNKLSIATKDKNILRVMAVIIILILVFATKSGYLAKEHHKQNLNKQFSGVVDSLYTDRANHNSPMIRLKGGRLMVNYFGKKVQDIRIGDSLVKKKGIIIIDLYRDEKVVATFSMEN